MPGFSLNLIRVGSEQFTAADEQTIATALLRTRAIYATVGFSVYREEHYFIPNTRAEGYSVIDQDIEAEWLTALWTVPNNAIDVFLVKGYVGVKAGLSPLSGPCDKNLNLPYITGSVVELVGDLTSIVLPHEVGHYLGLPDEPGDSMNLMYPSAPNGGLLRFGQGVIIRSHCFIEA
jgi:hypothetical protein